MNGIAITSVGYPALRERLLWARRNLEWMVAATVFLGIVAFHDSISDKFASRTWDIGAFYSAVFDWSSIQAAFLFSVYAFFLSRSEPFIQAISKTKPFRDLRNYVLRSLMLSMSLTLLSLPLLISSPSTESGGGLGFLVFVALATLLTYTFMCFVKVIRVFRKLERVQDRS